MMVEHDEENGQDTQELIPVEQHTLLFYGKPIIVVRLPDGRPAVVLRFLCENMGLEPRAQIRRVRTTEVIAEDLALQARMRSTGLPLVMRDELHVHSDRLGVALRRALTDFDLTTRRRPAA